MIQHGSGSLLDRESVQILLLLPSSPSWFFSHHCNRQTDFFNIKLQHPYKTYTELKERKGSRTKFLNELILKLEQKMLAEDA